MKLFSLTVALLILFTALGCQSMNKQPTDPYAATRIPAPATYSYSPTILGQQSVPSTYNPPGAATTYPPENTAPTAPPPATVPVMPSPTPGPISSELPASTFGSLDSGSTLYSTAATSTATPSTWTASQSLPLTPSSETAIGSMDALTAAPITTGIASPATIDTWSTSSAQVVTQVVE